MNTFDVGEYVTKGGYEAVVKFILPSPDCDRYDRIGYIKGEDNIHVLNKWTKSGISDRQPSNKFDLQVPRTTSWKIRCVKDGQTFTYGPFHKDNAYKLLNKEFNDCDDIKLIQCIELNPGERLIGDRIVHIGKQNLAI